MKVMKMVSKIRQKYSKLASQIRRKAKILEQRMPEAVSVQRYRGEFPKLRDLGNVSESALRRGIKEAERLLQSNELSLRANKKSQATAIQTLNERGYNYINNQNFGYFMNFLDDARARGLASIYGYQYLLDTFNRAKKRGLSDDEIRGNIQYWANQADRQKAIAMKKGIPLEELEGKRLYIRRGRKYDSSSESFQRSKRKK